MWLLLKEQPHGIFITFALPYIGGTICSPVSLKDHLKDHMGESGSDDKADYRPFQEQDKQFRQIYRDFGA